MNKMTSFPALALFLIFGGALASFNLQSGNVASSAESKTLILYDAASGTIPSAPLMSFIDAPPGNVLPAYSEGVTMMDTITPGRDTYAGWLASGATTPGFPSLNRAEGFQVNFAIQVDNESHTNDQRAGFNVVLLGEDARGIELAFWEDQIWVQSDDSTGGLFTHGEGIAFATTAGLTDYQLTIVADTYTLTANAESILTGPLRDYSKFEGFPDPYETPNFLFLGDDTTSAGSRVRLSLVSITGTEPVFPTATTSASTAPGTPSPPPTDSPTPLPSPTPAGTGFEFCPSSGVLVMLIAIMGLKRTGSSHDMQPTARIRAVRGDHSCDG